MTQFIVETVDEAIIVYPGENTAEAGRQAALAAQSAAYAGGFETPEYASQSAGNAATTAGQIFRVPLGTSPQTFSWYRRLSSGSELVSPLATTADLASTAAGKGASLVGLAQGGDAQDMADVYKNAVFSASYASVEAAHAAAVSAGKSYVVVNSPWVLTANFTATLKIIFAPGFSVSCGAYTLALNGGFVADDLQQVFSSADSDNITLPASQRLTPFHFGAKADYVSSGSPGTDDGDALNAWANQLCWRVMPRGNYGTTKTVFWNGAVLGNAANDAHGIKAEEGATIWQRTDNIPIFVFYGARGQWRFPRLEFVNVQSRDNRSAICALCSTYPGQGNGFYRNSVPFLSTRGGAVSVFFPSNINSTISGTTAAGATSIAVAGNRTEHSGIRPWVAGMYVQIELNDGTFFITKITSSDANTPCNLGIADPLPQGTGASKLVVVSPTKMISNATAQGGPTVASNNWDYVLCEYMTRYGWVNTSLGTQDVFLNRYIDGGTSYSDVTWFGATLVAGIYESVRNGDVHVLTNIEHYEFTEAGWFIGGDPASMGQIHAEGLRVGGNGKAIIGGNARSVNIDLLQVVYCTILGTSYDGLTTITSGGIFGPQAGSSLSSNTQLSGTNGEWRVRNLHTAKNIITPGLGFILRDGSAGKTRLSIDCWNYERDSGIYPTPNLVSSVSGAAPWNFTSSVTTGLIRIGNLLPANTVAFRLDADLTTTSAQDMFASGAVSYKVNKIVYRNASIVPTTATAGAFNESGAINLVSAVNNTALSALTSKTGTIIEPGLSVNETGKTRSAGTRIFFKCLASETAPAAVIGQSSYLTGRNGGAKNTNVGVINCTAHGCTVGDVVVITGSVNTALNSTFKVVDVPSANQLVVYVDSATAVGSASSPITDAAISVRRRPTVDVFAIGDEYGV